MNDRIKDYFAFNKKEQRGLIALLGLLLLSVLANFFLPVLIPDKEYDITPFKKEVEEFMASLKKTDSLAKSFPEKTYKNFDRKEDTKALDGFTASPFNFDPNKLNEEDWSNMGMPDKIIKNILSYRDKGGQFYDKKDLRKIYGMNDGLFAVLEPFIEIKKTAIRPSSDKYPSSYNSNNSTKKEPGRAEFQEDKVIIELNSADSATLLGYHGIGPSFAVRILRYRDRLGGFVRPGQLLEIRGMDSTRLDQFRDQITIDSSFIKKIDLNTVTFKELLRHPYFEYYLVKAIFNEKDEIKAFDSVEQLKYLPVMYQELFEKIAPYLYVSYSDR